MIDKKLGDGPRAPKVSREASHLSSRLCVGFVRIGSGLFRTIAIYAEAGVAQLLHTMTN